MMVEWDDEAALGRELDKMTEQVAEDTFPTFCRLISLFDEFQFRGSNTYLLQSHFAGEACKRLYNAFVEALPPHDEAGSLETLKIAAVMRASLPAHLATRPEKIVAELPGEIFWAEVVPAELSAELQAWKDWLRLRTPEVAIVADVLRTYNELLSHELALLYQTFFGRAGLATLFRGKDGIERYRGAVKGDLWPRVIGRRSLVIIELVSLRPSLLKPLGRGGVRREREPVKDRAVDLRFPDFRKPDQKEIFRRRPAAATRTGLAADPAGAVRVPAAISAGGVGPKPLPQRGKKRRKGERRGRG